MELASDTLFRSNWSYRPEARQQLTVSAEERFPIDECTACGFVYAGLLPDAEFLRTVYDCVIDADAARRANLSAAGFAGKMDYLRTLLRLCADRSPLRVLDFGCGFGPTLQLVSAIPSVEAIGYETSAARLRDLQARGLHATGDRADLLARAPFAAIVLDNVLEHVPEPKETLEFIRAVSETGTVLFISVPDTDRASIIEQQQALATKRAVAMEVNPWEHLNYFDLPNLDRLLAPFGFEPCPQASLPAPVEIGLRPSASRTDRLKNGLASVHRLVSYVAQGDVAPSVTRRFYMLRGAN